MLSQNQINRLVRRRDAWVRTRESLHTDIQTTDPQHALQFATLMSDLRAAMAQVQVLDAAVQAAFDGKDVAVAMIRAAHKSADRPVGLLAALQVTEAYLEDDDA